MAVALQLPDDTSLVEVEHIFRCIIDDGAVINVSKCRKSKDWLKNIVQAQTRTRLYSTKRNMISTPTGSYLLVSRQAKYLVWTTRASWVTHGTTICSRCCMPSIGKKSINNECWTTSFKTCRPAPGCRRVVRHTMSLTQNRYGGVGCPVGLNLSRSAQVRRVARPGDRPTEGLFTPKTRVFSAAEILLRIYQNPIHLNGTRWRTRFWRQREVRRRPPPPPPPPVKTGTE